MATLVWDCCYCKKLGGSLHRGVVMSWSNHTHRWCQGRCLKFLALLYSSFLFAFFGWTKKTSTSGKLATVVEPWSHLLIAGQHLWPPTACPRCLTRTSSHPKQDTYSTRIWPKAQGSQIRWFRGIYMPWHGLIVRIDRAKVMNCCRFWTVPGGPLSCVTRTRSRTLTCIQMVVHWPSLGLQEIRRSQPCPDVGIGGGGKLGTC